MERQVAINKYLKITTDLDDLENQITQLQKHESKLRRKKTVIGEILQEMSVTLDELDPNTVAKVREVKLQEKQKQKKEEREKQQKLEEEWKKAELERVDFYRNSEERKQELDNRENNIKKTEKELATQESRLKDMSEEINQRIAKSWQEQNKTFTDTVEKEVQKVSNCKRIYEYYFMHMNIF